MARTLSGVIVLPLMVLLSAASVSAQDDTRTFSCPVFPRDLRETDLIDRYGSENVVRSMVVGFDDGPQDGTVLFPSIDDSRVTIMWHDNETRSKPRWISVRTGSTRWETPGGISVGLDLSAVERRNEAPFVVAGFATEMQGVVRSWGGGRLQPQHASEDCLLRIQFQPQYGGTEDLAVWQDLTTNRENSSDLPEMRRLNPSVVSMSISYSNAANP